jgi:serine/threonine-protein kinase HipA
MKNKTPILNAYLFGEPVGLLTNTPRGMAFQYDENANHSISLGFPTDKLLYTGKNVGAFFAGLLPDAAETRNIIGKKYGVSGKNDFGLLRVIGHECAGALSFHEPGDIPPQQDGHTLEGHELTPEAFEIHILELPQRPLFEGLWGLRLSLAGVQDKAALCITDNKFIIPINGCPSTHIIKPPIKFFAPHSNFNEYACLKLATAIGLNAAEVSLIPLNKVEVVAIKRYDRQIMNDKIYRLHQEDFCQALGIFPHQKYENEGGPGFKECYGVSKLLAPRAISSLNLLQYYYFNLLIGNNDAHAKNYSVLYDSKMNATLAPIYDVLCSALYKEFSPKMAMKFGGEYLIEKVQHIQFEKFCNELGISPKRANALFLEMAQKLAHQLDAEPFEIPSVHQQFWIELKDFLKRRIDILTFKLKG